MKSAFALLACAGAASAQSLAAALNATNATSSLAGLLAGLPDVVSALGQARNVTLLAPNNAALARFTAENGAAAASNPGLIPAVLNYHVLNGTFRAADILNATNSTGSIFARTLLSNDQYELVNGSQYLEVAASNGNVTLFSGLGRNSSVVQTDIAFDGGVIHVIDNVLTIPANISTTAVAANLTALVGALTRVNLAGAVQNLTNITVFAPTNLAFQNIGSALTNITNDTLSQVLTYHVVNSSVLFSTQIQNGTSVPTLNGGNVTVTVSGGRFFVNGARILQPNNLVKNGVVHVIEDVLNPANSTARPASGSSTGANQFQNATGSPDTPLTSGVATPTSSVATRPTSSGAGGAAAATSSSSTAGAAVMTQIAMPIVGALAAGAAFLL